MTRKTVSRTESTEPESTVLQEIVFPDLATCTETELFFRASGPAGFDRSERSVHLAPGGVLELDTYFNAFDFGQWQSVAQLKTLGFRCSGQGEFEVQVLQAVPDRSDEILSSEVVTLTQDRDHFTDLSTLFSEAAKGVAYVRLRSLRHGRFLGGRFVTFDPPKSAPRLAISITTFKREKEVQDTVRRLNTFLERFEHGKNIAVQVVDNGGTAEVPETEFVRYIENANLGGAGGFARGLKEAKAAGFTHCLFMDDDASFDMENIRRTYALLAMSADPKLAVAGAMITNAHKWAMWENGAIFDGSCKPQSIGVDLREPEQVFDMLFEANTPKPTNFYGGWWFFAFPVAQAVRFPFPFFVRGDDISFSLANDFHIRTLNGIVSFQDDFGAKESPLTLYLDLRNHLVHHLVFEHLDRGALGTARVALRFFLRSLAKFHYESAEAQLLALRDVMRGPDFFLENADMSARRARIADLTKTERWIPDEPAQPVREPRWVRLIPDRLWAYTLNGHFVPFHGRLGAKRNLAITDRGALYPVWGASQITYTDRVRQVSYTVRHSKTRGLGLVLKACVETARFLATYPGLKDEYRKRYRDITEERTWDQLLGLESDARI